MRRALVAVGCASAALAGSALPAAAAARHAGAVVTTQSNSLLNEALLLVLVPLYVLIGVFVFLVVHRWLTRERRGLRRPRSAAGRLATSSEGVRPTGHVPVAHPPPPAPPDGRVTRFTPRRNGAAAPPPPTYYCSWCGVERHTDLGVHHCGSRQRPPRFCMRCGDPLDTGVVRCLACGTSVSELSPS